MKSRVPGLPLALLFLCAVHANPLSAADTGTPATPESTPIYELRIYYAHPGKFPELLTRFREHTVKLFEKHGMANVGYFVPPGENNDKLVYFLAYPSRAARDASWQAFLNDPVWKEVYAKSHENGPLVKQVESKFLIPTDYSPAFTIEKSKLPRVFEMRTYIASEGNLPALNARFRNHTVKLFEKHGMTNIVYFNLMPGQPGAENTLLYLISHPSEEARHAAFKAFAADPDWQAARADSEKQAGGSLTAKGGVQFEFLYPTDFSPLK
ncbi:MAG: NIPSNAP family protein [Planctomycetaceae bacterium]|nr:NIPSNAP family protein [Planctomycetaceae bacterium]